MITHFIENKGTYKVKTLDGEGNKILTTEMGFTFIEENGVELGFDVHEIEGAGTALLFGNQVFFLKYWTDDQLDRAAQMFNQAIKKEKEVRSNETS